ncbi:unnamed protein product [Amoebophrya sp. A120]|nr:unnamed protein product [Amoebophrya sp. A120]|eukprot:GSA120T00016229001.1
MTAPFGGPGGRGSSSASSSSSNSIQPYQTQNLPSHHHSADYYREKTSESLQRTLTTLKQTDEIATKSCLTLDSQTEQIQRTQAYADATESNLDMGEQILKGMTSFFGRVKGAFSSAYEQTSTTFGLEEDGGEQTTSSSAQNAAGRAAAPDSSGKNAQLHGGQPPQPPPPQQHQSALIYNQQPQHSNSSSKNYTNYANPPGGAPLSREDQDMALMEQLVGGLKEKSLAMNQTLGMQNDMLDKLNETTDRNVAKVERNQTLLKKQALK